MRHVAKLLHTLSNLINTSFLCLQKLKNLKTKLRNFDLKLGFEGIVHAVTGHLVRLGDPHGVPGLVHPLGQVLHEVEEEVTLGNAYDCVARGTYADFSRF